jgi:putative ABC transport system permease protein
VSRPPRRAATFLRWLAPDGHADDVLGDLEESRRRRLRQHGAVTARVLITIEALDMILALARARFHAFRTNRGNSMLQDYKLGVRMLLKYPGLTFAGGLALAIAIGLGAAWYDLSGDLFRPKLPLPGGERIVEIEMRDPTQGSDERRILHDFVTWRQELRSVADLGAYRTIERTLVLGDARTGPQTVAEITAAAFRVAAVPPLMGRPLVDADEKPGAAPVVVLGYDVWRQHFSGRADAIGQTVQLGKTARTIVGVMPEGFAFPINHRLWIPLQLSPSGYQPLEGVAVRVFGRIAPQATQAQANAEVTALVASTAVASPRTHQHLRPRVLAYGGESPGDRTWVELAARQLPILLVLIVACANVGTLIYARTATRDAEIAIRYALGATRGRIVTQLFIEALVLASVAAMVGLGVAHWALKWGFSLYLSGGAQPPFWLDPGLKPTTVLYAVGLTAAGAALLGALPAIKATGTEVQSQLRNAAVGAGATLRFGWVWTTVMIFQVALTVVCIPPAIGIATEAVRDRKIRSQFPAAEYLAVRVAVEPDTATAGGEESSAAVASRLQQTYREFERRIAQDPSVRAITFGDRLPGMEVAVRSAEVETSPEGSLLHVPNLWTAAVGPGYFETFDKPIVAGRNFHDGDRAAGAHTVLVNESFARRYTNGASPVGRRVRWAAADPATPERWFEIVGVVRDMGMTPTDLGEAPYLFRAVSVTTATSLVMAVRAAGDPAVLAPRLRAIAAELDSGLRLDDMRTLEDAAWRIDVPMMVGAGTIVSVVALGLFLSAAGIFSLMSVSVARRTREIGLRAALGASPRRLLARIFSQALVLIGTGVIAGNAILIGFIALEPEVAVTDVYDALFFTSGVMLTVGLLACVEPARRALRIHPTDALKEA